MVRSCQHHERYVSSTAVQCRILGEIKIRDCRGCKSFALKPQAPIEPTVIPGHAPTVPASPPEACRHLGTKLSVAPCCGQMYACRLHKGKKCAPFGITKDPFLSCSTCQDFAPAELWPANDGTIGTNSRVGFISAAYMENGGTETFHRSLLPRLKNEVDLAGFVATAFYGGDGTKLAVLYATGIESAKRLAAHCEVVVAWGLSNLREILPANRPKVIAVHHSDWSSDWSNNQILSQLDIISEIVCVNADTAKQLVDCGKPTHYIPNAIDPERIKPSGQQEALRGIHGIPAASKIVLFGHRLSEEKRPALAVEIARQLPHDWVMVIVGDGHERPAVEAAAADCDRVRIVGAVESLADWLSISDCFLSLSTFEGFGLSIGESMAAGVPTVSTPAGIAPGLATTLPTDSTAKEWAAAIVTAKRTVEPAVILDRFSVQRMVDSWASILKTITQAKE